MFEISERVLQYKKNYFCAGKKSVVMTPFFSPHKIIFFCEALLVDTYTTFWQRFVLEISERASTHKHKKKNYFCAGDLYPFLTKKYNFFFLFLCRETTISGYKPTFLVAKNFVSAKR